MTDAESTLVVLLIALVAVPFVTVGRPRSIFRFFAPPFMVSLFFLVYFLVGPLSVLISGDTFLLGTDMRAVFKPAWLAATVGLSAIWAGYYAPIGLMVARRFRSSDIDLHRYRACAMLFTAIGCASLIGWLALSGEVLEILGTAFGRAPQTIFEEAARFNYLYLGMSLAFVGIFMGLAVRTMSMPLALALLMPVVLVFAAIGFRSRLVFALGGLTVIMHLRRGSRPKIWLLSLLLAGLLITFGLLGTTRQYYTGIDLSRLADRSAVELYRDSLGETNTFFALGAVMDVVPATYGFAGFDPLYNALIMPVPRFVWPAKPYPEYLSVIPTAIGTEAAAHAGMALPFIGEYYVGFGFPGIVVMCFIFGIACRTLWVWYCQNPTDPTMMVIYALALPFIYYAMSRGYLAQVFSDFCFTLLPALVARRLCTPSASRKAATKLLPIAG